MRLYISNDTDIELDPVYNEVITTAVQNALCSESIPDANIEISVSLVTNEEIKNLNNRYRQNDKTTDVLSFPQLYFDSDTAKNIAEIKKYLSAQSITNTDIILLGDVIISLEKASNQANEFNHSLERELAFLTVHSILHLLGYDHTCITDEKIMFARQSEILLYLPR